MRGSLNRNKVLAAAAVLLVLANLLGQFYIQPRHEEYLKAQSMDTDPLRPKDSALEQTSLAPMLAMLLGVREAVASVLWIRTDDFFHRGEYAPIIKLVKLITTIDPHQLDVYATGAWHMAYNFMDKRLIIDGIEFLEDGCRNNPGVYDLFFELGYMHRDKTKDFAAAAAAYRLAETKGRTTGEETAPAYVRHQLAHAYSRAGRIDDSIEKWRTNVSDAEALADEDPTFARGGQNFEAAIRNYYIQQRRRNERVAGVKEREGDRDGALRLWQDNIQICEVILKHDPRHKDVLGDKARAKRQVARLQRGQMRPIPMVDLDFQASWRRIAPRKIEISGTINVLNLARVEVDFRDKDYEKIAAQGLDYKMANATREWDRMQVKGQKFKWVLDLDRDPADMDRDPAVIYPLKSDEYLLTLTFNPRLQANFIQDRYGWNGENITDKDYLKIDEGDPGIVFGRKVPLRYLQRTFIIKKSDLLPGDGQT